MNKKSLSVGNVYVVKHGRDECKARLNFESFPDSVGREMRYAREPSITVRSFRPVVISCSGRRDVSSGYIRR